MSLHSRALVFKIRYLFIPKFTDFNRRIIYIIWKIIIIYVYCMLE